MKKNLLVAQHSIFYVVLCAMLFGLCSVAEAQQTKKVYRVRFLTPSTGKRNSYIRLSLECLQ
jgi:hypothetical protein